MDEMESAIVSVSGSLDADRAEDWFEVVCGTYDDFGENWSLFKDALATRAYEKSFSNDVAEAFVEFMEDGVSDQTDVLRQLSERRDELPRLYPALVAEEKAALAELSGGGAGTAAAGVVWDAETAAQWYLYLTQTVGSGWTGWNGDETGWEPFKDYFLRYAEQAGVATEAAALLASVERYPNKVEGFREHGITIEVARAPEGGGAQTADQWVNYSEKEWYDYLTAGWDGWSGREEDWETFKYYFLEYARNASAGVGATAFLEAIESSGNKHEELAKYDIRPVVPAPPPPPPAKPKPKADDQAKWVAFLKANVGRYKGTDSSWTFFKGWLVAEARGQGLGTQATSFVELAEEQGRDAAFAKFGVTVAAPAKPAEEKAKPEPAKPEPAKPEPAKAEPPAQVAKRIVGEVADGVLAGADLAGIADDVPRADLEQLIAEILQERAAAV